ncbi:ATP-binding protein [Chitinispirillales bacterium ANBcel5]|uniref:sensor histidine kinase n=1 Tax=Cellulosispirillum alkaliphilum TaxID=3039283 RepID=UPI002A4FB184|nr:ATP-binding protein [Chitinispirillales bacterium ANBcel5]
MRYSDSYNKDFYGDALIGFHQFGPDRKILSINDYELTLTGYSREEVVGKKSWADLIIPQHRERFEKHWAGISNGEDIHNFEYTLVRKDGSFVDVMLNATANFDTDGTLLNTQGIVVDISSRKQYERELSEKEESARQLSSALKVKKRRQQLAISILEELNGFNCDESDLILKILDQIQSVGEYETASIRLRNNSDDGELFTTISKDARISSRCLSGSSACNSSCGKLTAAKELFEYPRTVWVNSKEDAVNSDYSVYSMIFCCQNQGFNSIALIPLWVAGEPFGFLQIADTRQGKFNAEAISFLEGMVSSIGIALSRIRNRAQLAESNRMLSDKNRQLDTLIEKLHAANEQKTEFLSMVAHEVRNPLAGIIGFAQTLRSSGENISDSEREKFLAVIESEGRRMTSLIEELLDVTKIENGIIKMEHACFNLKAIVDEAAETVRVGNNSVISIVNRAGESFVHGDKNRIKQVLLNLLVNAAKHGGDGKEITVSVEEDDGYLKVGIKDQGPGISGENLSRVFNKFFQIKGSSSAKSKGSGLGLSIAKEIVSAHGGTIRVESSVGEGATFNFTVPVCGEEVEKREESPSL